MSNERLVQQKRKILIVEDEQLIATLVQTRLKSVGFDVFVAHDGEAGLETAKQERPDLILLDLMLPKLPGEEVCRAIRNDEDKKFAQTPIIMLTAKDSMKDRLAGRQLGATAYVAKPFTGDDLLKEIKVALPSRE